ncbi:MAG: hypothetical protein U9Q70_13190 [Chloroflexota bacterium]|nr:hypothetical protein [Chloroflexota bacterium]
MKNAKVAALASKLSLFCDSALEAGWLIGIIITPVFFNVYSSRVFEPDKLTSLRSLAVVMAVLWLVRFLEEILQKQQPLRFSWRTPLVLPALLTMVLYIVSSIFSLVPYTSFVGSYQRLQGTFTLFGYLVLFFAILTSLRTRAQLSRLFTTLILSSLPVALYGIVQHNGLDPLPWAGNVQTRVASNMGNAIFVAAYLIMIVPLTAMRIVESFRDIMSREKARISDILRASSYIFIVAVQLLTIWYSRSRGPWLGIITASFIFPYLMFILLQRRAVAETTAKSSWWQDVLRGAGLGLGSLAVSGLLLGLGWLALPGEMGLYVGGGLALLAFGGIWLYFVVERKGWRWLWIGWFTLGLVASLGLLAINLPGPLHERARTMGSVSRMSRMFEWEGGTGKVRVLIWEGALDMISMHEPLTFPDGSHDSANFLRPLIGYGPEAMYVGYNSFYPPLLGHYESRTASPDRSHNETLDSLVITGLFGLGIYLLTFGAVFYWGFRWLGLLETRRQFWLYVGLMAVIASALIIYFISIGHLYFFAVAIPLGFIAGIGLYLTWQAGRLTWRGAEALPVDWQLHPHALLLVAILAAISGHFIEINFGISIAATRTIFWVLGGMLVVLGSQWLPAEEVARAKHAVQSRKRQHRSRPTQKAWLWPVLTLSLVAVFLLSTLAYDFITNPDRSTDSSQVLWQSLTTIYTQGRTSYGALMIFVFTGVLFGVVGLCELDREEMFSEERNKHWGMAVLIYSGVTLTGLLLFGSNIASFHARLPQIQVQTIEDVVQVAMTLAGVLGHYYLLIFLLLIGMSLLLMRESVLPARWAEPISLLVLPVLLLFGIILIRTYSYDLIRADIVFKQGSSFANQREANQKQIGIAHYNQAIELTPHEDYYRLFQGKAHLELAQSLPQDVDAAQREAVLKQTEAVLLEAREINPLNTDHSANLARFYRSWGASLSDATQREELLEKASTNYHHALTLSPHNPILWNELAILNAFELHDQEAFTEAISQSLEIDAEFEQTWMTLGDVRLNIDKDMEGAMAAYQQALEIQPRNCTVRHTLGSLQVQQSLWAKVEETLVPAAEYCATSSKLWDMYRLLAISYYYQERPEEALQLAQQALPLAPEDQREVVEQLIAAIQQPLPVPPESEP